MPKLGLLSGLRLIRLFVTIWKRQASRPNSMKKLTRLLAANGSVGNAGSKKNSLLTLVRDLASARNVSGPTVRKTPEFSLWAIESLRFWTRAAWFDRLVHLTDRFPI